MDGQDMESRSGVIPARSWRQALRGLVRFLGVNPGLRDIHAAALDPNFARSAEKPAAEAE